MTPRRRGRLRRARRRHLRRLLRRPAPQGRARRRRRVPPHAVLLAQPRRALRPRRSSASSCARATASRSPWSTPTATRCASSSAAASTCPFREIRAKWDGRDDDGERVPDGRYRYRITLQEQGRNVIVPQSVRLDTTPPRPRVLSIGPVADRVPRPELLPVPGGGAARGPPAGARAAQADHALQDRRPGPARRVRRGVAAPTTPTRGRWDGRTPSGPPGLARDLPRRRCRRATRRATSARRCRSTRARPAGRRLRRDAARARRDHRALPGRAAAGARRRAPARAVAFGVDARGERWRWSVRRVGSNEVIRRAARRARAAASFRLTAPGARVGRLPARGAHARAHASPSRSPSRAPSARPVLVVLPLDDLAGAQPGRRRRRRVPNLLDRGVPARVGARARRRRAARRLRRSATRRCSPGWRAPSGASTSRPTSRSPAARARGSPATAASCCRPTRAGCRARCSERLRRWRARGGTLLSLGTDSLRRQVALTPRGRLDRPDAAGADRPLRRARSRRSQRPPEPVDADRGDDAIELFAGTDGLFPGWSRARAAAGRRRPARGSPRRR